MPKQIVITLTIALSTLVTQNAWADSCQKLTVISPDGYANVRSLPEINNNIIGTLITGTGVQKKLEQQRWIKLNSPIVGWIAKSQIKILSCDDSLQLLIETGLPTISRLGQQAINNNLSSAETLVNLSIGVDGLTAEAYAITIVNWARQNPRFLITVLEKQSSAIRRAFLESLDFGLAQSKEREKFETILNQLPLDNPVFQDWQYLQKK